MKKELELYKAIAETSFAAFFIVQDGKLCYINDNSIGYTGYTAEELVGQNSYTIVHPEDQETVKKMGQEMLDKRSPFEYRIVTKDGQIRWIVQIISSIEFDGRPAILGNAIDITERKHAEEELRFSNLILSTQQESSIDGILVVDKNGKILSLNQRFIDMWNIPHDIVASKSDMVALKSVKNKLANPEEFYNGVNYLYANPKETSHDEISLKNGQAFERYSAPMLDKDATYHGRVWYFRDITERKQAEKTLFETERLSAIGELSSGVAHDFNNSLQIILGNIELALLVPGVSKEVAEYLRSIKKRAEDTAARVRQLQRFAKKISTTDFRALNLNTLLEEAILQSKPLWKNEAEKKGLQISFQEDYGSIKSVDGDEGELNSAFHNLIKNAIEAMPDGGMITLKTSIIKKEVCITIADTGTGMNEETRKRIFQPFFSTKGLESGRGLGMSAAYSIIRDHGGKMSVKETIIGQGTTIEILLPFGKIKPVNYPLEISGECQESARILWVDDEKSICDLGKMQLEKLGHQADIANSGKEALVLLEKNQYDLLISDIGMPGMSGWQLAEAIKDNYADMKVAIVSGWGTTISNEKKAQYGVGYILGKPTSMKELANLIREVLQSKI